MNVHFNAPTGAHSYFYESFHDFYACLAHRCVVAATLYVVIFFRDNTGNESNGTILVINCQQFKTEPPGDLTCFVTTPQIVIEKLNFGKLIRLEMEYFIMSPLVYLLRRLISRTLLGLFSQNIGTSWNL